MAKNANALKMSLLCGLASGVGSLGLYYMLTKGKREQKDDGISVKEQMKFTSEVEEM